MTTPSERLAAAKAKPRKHADVEILLDSGASDERDALQAKLESLQAAAAADPRLASEDPEIAETESELEALLTSAADDIAIIRVIALPGRVWSDIESRSPVRVDAPGDMHFGYNTQAAALKALPVASGWLVDGEVVPLTADEWVDLFDTISGTEAALLESAVWELNVANPQVAIADAKKASAARLN